jgi:alpha-L-fucosidase 2
MMEMFVQSQNGKLHLLPALPSELPSGTIKGLRVRGGFTLTSLSWNNRQLTSAKLVSSINGATITAMLGSGTTKKTIKLNAGQSMTLTPATFGQ